MRALELVLSRAQIPVKYTQGFNPHPRISMPCPRPVGLSARDDLLVLTLTEPVDGDELVGRLNSEAPMGMRFTRAEELASVPHPVKIQCELPIAPDRIDSVRERIQQLREAESWPVERSAGPDRRDRTARRTVDIRPGLEQIDLEDGLVRMTLSGTEGRWAKPAEVLEAIGMDGRADLAVMVRTQVDYD